MKKNLRYIFDNATPDELDIISYKLESEEIEDATLESIKEKVFSKTNLKRSSENKKKWIWSAAVAAVLCFAVGLAAISSLARPSLCFSCKIRVSRLGWWILSIRAPIQRSFTSSSTADKKNASKAMAFLLFRGYKIRKQLIQTICPSG